MIKKANYILAIFLLNVICLQAQDYQTVRSARIAYFQNDMGKVECIRIDSVKFHADSILLPMPQIRYTGDRCFTPKGNSWIGKKVIIQNEGTNLFFNWNNDTIRIKTNAWVNESWTVFEIKDSIKIIAEVTKVDNITVLEELDSVKTIGFQVYDKNGIAKSHYLNGKSLIISKKYGFVRLMNFNFFPHKPAFNYDDDLESFSLIGLTNPHKGVQNLTWLGVHDYQVGDELHVISNSWNWSVVPGYRNELKTIWKFLERIESIDSVFYRIERKELLKRSVEKWDNISYTFTHDTITAVYKPDSLFDKLPGEPIVSNYGADINVMINEGTFIKKITSYQPIRKSLDDSCWHQLIFDGGGPGYYLKGLGGPYYEWNEIISGDDRALVYYKKGTAKWGTPLVITDVKSIEKDDQLKVYPNPASDFIILENISGRTENYILQVIDMQGREVFRNAIEIANSYRLDLSSFREGVYLLKLQNGEKQVSRMIIKKR